MWRNKQKGSGSWRKPSKATARPKSKNLKRMKVSQCGWAQTAPWPSSTPKWSQCTRKSHPKDCPPMRKGLQISVSLMMIARIRSPLEYRLSTKIRTSTLSQSRASPRSVSMVDDDDGWQQIIISICNQRSIRCRTWSPSWSLLLFLCGWLLSSW